MVSSTHAALSAANENRPVTCFFMFQYLQIQTEKWTFQWTNLKSKCLKGLECVFQHFASLCDDLESLLSPESCNFRLFRLHFLLYVCVYPSVRPHAATVLGPGGSERCVLTGIHPSLLRFQSTCTFPVSVSTSFPTRGSAKLPEVVGGGGGGGGLSCLHACRQPLVYTFFFFRGGGGL